VEVEVEVEVVVVLHQLLVIVGVLVVGVID
jgi:hypothetical protein